jgi:hypothetical protein
MISEYSLICSKLTDRFNTIIEKKPNVVLKDANFIRANTKPGEKFLILSNQSGVYYLTSQTVCPIGMPSLTELLAKKDYENINNFLENNRNIKVFVDINVITLSPYLNKTKLNMINLILRNYEQIDLSKSQTMQYLAPKVGNVW